MMTSQVWAVVVARTGPSAKSRLAMALTPTERSALALRMLEAVLATCRAADLGGTIVVTETEQGATLARAMDALVMPDPGAGLNAAVALGLDAVGQQAPGTAALVLPGDVPLIEVEDVRAIIDAAADHARVVVAVPDTAGRGTNALLIRPPHLIEPSFGEPSFERHLSLARHVGIAIALEVPRVALDIDHQTQLQHLNTMVN